MNSLLEILKKTIDVIQNHPDVIVDELTINPPVTSAKVEALETVAGIGVPLGIKEFYQEANGITFIWRLKPESDATKVTRIKEKIGDPDYDFSKPLGVVRILSLEDMLLNTKWIPLKNTDPDASKPFDFGNKEYTYASFSQMLRPFDFYYPDNDAQCMAFIVYPQIREYKFDVIMLDNYFADWQSSYITDFETYIKAICATQFTISGRKRLFGKYRGDQEPPISFDKLNGNLLEPALI